MSHAAGILFCAPSGKVLLLKRQADSRFGGTWGLPGGHIEEGETPEQAARREAREELGEVPAMRLSQIRRTLSTGVDYTLFQCFVKAEFGPTDLQEHDDWVWLDPNVAVQLDNLHPGLDTVLSSLNHNELDIAQSIQTGALPSPQHYGNMWLFAIRITGTGLSYRGTIKEHVWRDKELYLNDRFLQRCQGLPVVWIHPRSKILTSKEFASRVIGSVMLPYIKDDEVWGVARIYDDDAAALMEKKQYSTSPGVAWEDPFANTVRTAPDGNQLLIEDDPSLLDHIAVVEYGVWDKGGPPTGVQSDMLLPLERTDSMTPEEQAAAIASAQAAFQTKVETALDKIMGALSSVTARVDSMSEKDAEREDRARKDAAARRDAEHEEWMRDDAEECKRDDAEEDKARKDMEEAGDPPDVAADKARKDRRARRDARKDKARKDAEEKEAKEREDKARKDAEEAEAKKKEEEERARNDSMTNQTTEIERLRAEVAAMRAVIKGPDQSDYDALAGAQQRCDSIFRAATGEAAPRWMAGEAPGVYELRLHRSLQKFSDKWKGIDLPKVTDPNGLQEIFHQIRSDAMEYAKKPIGHEDGRLRCVERRDASGHTIREYFGKGTFINRMNRPSRYVSSIKAA